MLLNNLWYGLAVIATAEAALFEALHGVPHGWYEVGKPPGGKTMHFRIAMTHPGDNLLEQTLYDMSTPSNSKYGKHMKRDEVKSMLRPSTEATDTVLDWLNSFNISQSDIVNDGDFINFVADVSTAEEMLDTEFHTYRNRFKSIDRIRTLSYSLPEEVHRFVDMIQPTTYFGQMKPQRSGVLDSHHFGTTGSALNLTNCNETITPGCIKSLYNIGAPSNGTSGFIGINGFLEEYPRYTDFQAFETKYASYMKNESFDWTSVKGGLLNQTSTSDSGEANLDVQYALAVGFPLPGNYYSTAGRGELVPDNDQPNPNEDGNEPYLDLFSYLLSLADDELPHTLTTSYGEDEQSVPASYAKTVCNMIGQLGLRGVSVLFSSGDTGVSTACETNDGKNTTRFLPIFPAACPYVTAVGGTYGVQPERAVSFSSGGFSDLWSRPSYQEEAVSTYLNILGDRWSGLYNSSGRGFPDVAAQARYYHVFDQGHDSLLSGTSCASPTFAGVIGLINSELIGAGRSPLGFLNPWIYSEGYNGLTDIVDGGSNGCVGIDSYSGLTTPIVPYASWNATTGWDPVTGYGTPDYSKLLKIAMK